jgi:hypothetical protein
MQTRLLTTQEVFDVYAMDSEKQKKAIVARATGKSEEEIKAVPYVEFIECLKKVLAENGLPS